MTSPRVSVVMPVFNVAPYVAEAVQSVLDQVFTDFELVIVDDGGTDDSIAICRTFDDPRIRIVHQQNRGLAGARNTGIAHARGEVIALLDPDDRWSPEKLRLHVIHLDADTSVGVSYSGSRFIDADGTILKQGQRPRLEDIAPHHILCRNPVGNGSAAVIRRAALDRIVYADAGEPQRPCYFDESFRQSEDIELWIRMSLASGYRFDGIAPLLTDYRIIGGGLSANIARQFESWERVIDKVRTYAPEFVVQHGAAARAYQLRYLARRSVQLGDGSFALSLIGEALSASCLPLWQEPRKTLLTVAAALLTRICSPGLSRWVARRWSGGKIMA